MPPIVSEDRRPLGLLGLLIALCLACDFLMALVLPKAPGPPRILGVALALSVVGCVLAQGCLLAAWLAWGDQPFGQRLARHWTIAAISYFVWTVGMAFSALSRFGEVRSVVGLSVPLVSIAAQTPLWIARQTFGWRLIRGEEN